MLNLLLSIFTSVAWLMVLRSFKNFNIHTLQAVVCNYWVCVIIGLLIMRQSIPDKSLFFMISWNGYTFVLGCMFIGTFYLTGQTAKYAGLTLASVASKASMVIPVMANLFIFGNAQKQFDILNYAGILLALVAVFLTSAKYETNQQHFNPKSLMLPFAVFLLNGLCDTGTNYINLNFVQTGQEALFTILTFASAGIAGLVMLAYTLVIQKEKFEAKSIAGGIAIGIPNFFSLFFMVKALADFNNNGAFVFPIFNISIILLSSLLAVILYKEKLSWLNKTGLLLAAFAIFLLAYQEILGNFS